MDKVKDIRNKEIEYHEWLYNNRNLFESGSWLQKPVKTVLDSFNLLENKTDITILDLGSGVGRNAIPLALELKGSNSKVICLDMLETATKLLRENAKKYNVDSYINAYTSTIEDYDITSSEYDFVVAVSALEHIESKELFIEKLSQIAKHTKHRGINCLILNTSVEEILIVNGKILEPQFELNLDTEEMDKLLDDIYGDWDVLKRNVSTQSYVIVRGGDPVLLNTNVITYVSRKV